MKKDKFKENIEFLEKMAEQIAQIFISQIELSKKDKKKIRGNNIQK